MTSFCVRCCCNLFCVVLCDTSVTIIDCFAGGIILMHDTVNASVNAIGQLIDALRNISVPPYYPYANPLARPIVSLDHCLAATRAVYGKATKHTLKSHH